MNKYSSQFNELNEHISSLLSEEYGTEKKLELIRRELEQLNNQRYELLVEFLNYIKSEDG